MRILLVHNYYGSTAPSGENKVFEAERAMLERHGEIVEVFTRQSDEIRGKGLWGLLKGALCTIGNPFAARELSRKIREFKPDVVHFHNTFPLISPLAIRVAKKSGTKVVMTLHNYRMVCAAGIPMRCGKVCRECFSCVANSSISQSVNLSILPAIYHRCYRGSLLATVPLAINIWLYRKWWAKWVDTFIVLSEFQKKVMIECGLPTEKVVVKGNFVVGKACGPRSHFSESGEDTSSPLSGQRSGVVFVGRLSDEKGVKTLLKARASLQHSNNLNNPNDRTILTLIGDGDQRAEYEELAKGLNVRFLGKLSHDEVLKELSVAKLLVVPSECWETFGLVVVEAAMCGVPAVVSDLGALPSLVQDGRVGEVFRSGDANALADAIIRLLMREDYNEVCLACRNEAEEKYSEEANFRQLMDIYEGMK